MVGTLKREAARSSYRRTSRPIRLRPCQTAPCVRDNSVYMRSPAWLALALAPSLLLAQKKPFDASALLKIQRIADPQLSPDGKIVAFAVALPDLDANKSLHSVWTVPLDGGSPRKLADLADRPRWSPDGKRIYYVSTTGDVSQIWSMNPDGSGSSQVTHLSTEADGELVSA